MRWLHFIIITCLHTLSWQACAATTDCSLTAVEVKYEHSYDAEMACKGINRALGFFESQGYSVSGEIKIEFFDNLHVEKTTSRGPEVIKSQPCGYYYRHDGMCRITTWTTMRGQQIKLFGELEITEELFISLIVHEVSHCLYHHIVELHDHDMDQSLTEFISYTAQIETLKDPEKSTILKLFPEVTFTSALEINALNHGMNPHKFGVMSYRYFKRHPEIIDLILNGRIESGDKFFFDYQFLQR